MFMQSVVDLEDVMEEQVVMAQTAVVEVIIAVIRESQELELYKRLLLD
jgi:hypothetical protein